MKKSYIFLVISCCLYCLDSFSQTFQQLTSSGIPSVGRGGVTVADINNDQLLDVVLCGVDEFGNNIAGIYGNNGDDTFTNLGVGLSALVDGDVAIGDVNNDGLLDIFLIGANSAGETKADLFLNQGEGLFNLSTFHFEGTTFGNCQISDLNNDGFSDIVITGINASGSSETFIYINKKDGDFELINHTLKGFNNGALELADFNNDHYIDLLISGLNSSNQRETILYYNQGDLTFEDKKVGLPDIRSGAFAIADYNNDGYKDILVSGNRVGAVITQVYSSNQGEAFILETSLNPLEQGAAQWGDFDLDGDLDILVSGFEGASFRTYLYEQTAGGFVDSGIGFPGLVDGNINWFDFNNDNQLDVLVNGFSSLGAITNLYKNILTAKNTKPSPPTLLQVETKIDTVIFSWNQAVDVESSALTYEIYLGTASETFDLKAPLSFLNNGQTKANQFGVSINEYEINGLPEGIYYWSVQAIDAGYVRSDFATEQSFALCYPISLGKDTTLCEGDYITLEAGRGADQVKWYSKNRGLISEDVKMLNFQVLESDSLYVEVTRENLGCTVSAGIKIGKFSLPTPNLGGSTSVCSEDSISLNVPDIYDEVKWYSFREGELSDSTAISYFIDRNDTLSVMVKDGNGCFGYDSMSVSAIDLPSLDLGDDQTVCLGSTVFLSASADSVNWYSTSGSLLLNSDTFNIEIEAVDTVSAIVFDLNTGCSNTDSIQINYFELPVADAGEDKVSCASSAIQIGGDYSDVTGLSFDWIPQASLNDASLINPLAAPLEETIYKLTVTDSNNCQNSDNMTVYMDSASIINNGGDKTICYGESVQLGGAPTATGSSLSYIYEWTPVENIDDPGLANPTVSPDVSMTYELVVKTLNCVVHNSTVRVNVNPLPEIVVDPEIVSIGPGEQTTLRATGGLSYIWSPSEGLVDAFSASTLASPSESIKYEVEVADENGCIDYGEVEVIVENQFFVPELFTPNGDASNDHFKVYGEGIGELSLRIYDRNGLLVYQSSDVIEILETGWDGNYSGTPLESGHYVWAVEGKFYNGAAIQYKGKTSGILKLIR